VYTYTYARIWVCELIIVYYCMCLHGYVIMCVYLIKCMPIFIMWVFGYYCGCYMVDVWVSAYA